MCAIEADALTVREELERHAKSVAIAAINTPLQTIISGDAHSIAQLAERFSNRGVKSTPLTVSHAFHSSLMDPMLEEFESELKHLDLDIPKLPVVSTATGRLAQREMASSQYWVDQVRSPVLYMDAIRSAAQAQVTHFLEIGPQTRFSWMGQNCVQDSKAWWLASARKGHDDWRTILSSLGRLYVDGADVDWKVFDKPYSRRRVHVPGYTFEKRKVWIDQLGESQFVSGSITSASLAALAKTR